MSSRRPPPDWQMPPGLNRGLWDYVHDAGIAQRYDASLVGSSLFQADLRYVRRHCPGPARLVDLGCGTGRLALSLAQDGWQVLGVDLSMEMLRVARRRASELGVRVELLQANLVELDALADASFDHAACLFSTLGLIVGAAARRRVLEQTFRLLRPGGHFIVHVHNRWWHLRDGPGRRWLLGDLGRRLRGLPSGDRQMPPHQGIGSLTMHLFTRGECIQELTTVGFELLDVTPVGLGSEAHLRWPWLLGGFRAYGFLMAARKP